MKQTLTKILEGDIDVSQLSEQNINGYLQTQQMVARLNSLIIEPFKERAAQEESGQIYKGQGVQLSLTEKKSDLKPTKKEVLQTLESSLETFLDVNLDTRRLHGIRRFNGVAAVDAQYLTELLERWQDIKLGEKIERKISYKGNGVTEVEERHRGRLILDSYHHGMGISDSSVALYIAASEQVKRQKRRIIDPFEKSFKSNAKTDPSKTVFDDKYYGGLIVQVKTVPRQQPNYETVKNDVNALLEYCAGLVADQVDNKTTFFNGNLSEPRVYVGVKNLLSYIREQKERTEFKQRQEIKVLYAPDPAMILAA